MLIARAAVVTLAALSLAGCTLLEPAATDLVRGASAKMQTARTVHFEGTGTFGIKGGFSMSFDFAMSGDYDLPDKSRVSMQMAMLGQNVDVEMLTISGKAYMKNSATGGWTEAPTTGSSASVTPFVGSDPLSGFDLSTVTNVVEVDRPDIDGRKTRHVRFTVDAQKMADAMRQSMGSSPMPSVSPTANGEVWIRVDDGQIIREKMNITLALDDLPSALLGGLPGASTSPSKVKASMEMGFDFKFSAHGQPVPAITVPPLSTPRLPTLPPVRTPARTATPQPTR